MAEVSHALPPVLQRREGFEDLRHRAAAQDEPQTVINREIRDARRRSEEESLLAERLFEPFQVERKGRIRIRRTHARHIGAEHVPVIAEGLDGFGWYAIEHMRQSRRLHGEGNGGPKQGGIRPLRQDARCGRDAAGIQSWARCALIDHIGDQRSVAINVCADLHHRRLAISAGQRRYIRLRHDIGDVHGRPMQPLET